MIKIDTENNHSGVYYIDEKEIVYFYTNDFNYKESLDSFNKSSYILQIFFKTCEPLYLVFGNIEIRDKQIEKLNRSMS